MEEDTLDPFLENLVDQDTAWMDEAPPCLRDDDNVSRLDFNSYFDPIVNQCGRYDDAQPNASCRRLDTWEEDDGCIDDYTPATFNAGSAENRQVLNNVPTPQFLSLEVLEDPNDRVPMNPQNVQPWNRNGQRNAFSMWDRPW